ncbi:hypothetical protein BX600DRAFT_538536 [Xylariales sp. PMI_506]|nr:hypothetical protein BX600DRAFT_538536 [Xylariales sp. PMI_506]
MVNKNHQLEKLVPKITRPIIRGLSRHTIRNPGQANRQNWPVHLSEFVGLPSILVVLAVQIGASEAPCLQGLRVTLTFSAAVNPDARKLVSFYCNTSAIFTLLPIFRHAVSFWAALAAQIILAVVSALPSDTASLPIQSEFVGLPSIKYRPRVFWLWVNGNVNKEAIDKDIDALYRSGYGVVLMSDVNAGIPKGPVEYNSDEWIKLLLYALKVLKAKGMDMAIHNSPGYSGVGSKNILVNMTIKELVWTETPISSNATKATALQAPFQKMGVYEDLYVLAYPQSYGEGVPWRNAVASTSLNGVIQNTNITSTINLAQPLRLQSSSDSLAFEMTEPWTAQSIAVYWVPEIPQNTFDGSRDYPPTWTLAASNDSTTWFTVVKFSGPALRAMDAPATGVFSAIIAKYYRLTPSSSSWVTGVELTGGARSGDWATKSHAAPGSNVVNPAVVPAISSTSIIDPNSVIDVSKYMDDKGDLSWVPPNGTYTVVRVGYTITGQYMPATPDGHSGLSVDLFSTVAIDAQLDTHTNRIIEAVKPFIPDIFFGMEIDSYELATNCYGYFAEKLGEHGLALLVEPYGDGPFDGMEVATQVSHAYREYWAHNNYGSDGYIEIGTSFGDYRGVAQTKGMNFAECFTGQPISSAHTEHPYQLKAQGDREMSLGTNRFYCHSYSLQPVEAAWPGMMFGPFGSHFDRYSTWTNLSIAWMNQISRASLIPQSGPRLPDTLSFWGEEMNNGAAISYQSPYSVPLSYQQDDFGRSQLFQLTAVDKKAAYPSGTAVSLLLFPTMTAASSEVLTHMLYLAKAGVPILMQSTIPSRALGLNDSDISVTSLASELWGLAGNGNVFVGETAATVLKTIGVPPDMTFTSPSNDAAIYFAHNLINGDDVFFVTNQIRQPVEAVISLRATSGTPYIWNPTTGEITTVLSWSTESRRTNIGLSFDSHQSVFIWLSKSKTNTKQITSISKDDTALYTSTPYKPFTTAPWANISGTWTLSFWAKPEVAKYGSVGYIIYPPSFSAYGAGHSAAGIYFVLNGLELVEASTSAPTFVASLPDLGTGSWTHIALVYTDNLPTLYVNGVLVYTGTTSSSVVHPGLDAEDNTNVKLHRFQGDVSEINLVASALSPSQITSIFDSGVPSPYLPKAITITPTSDLIVRQNGNYTTTHLSGSNSILSVQSIKNITLTMPKGAHALHHPSKPYFPSSSPIVRPTYSTTFTLQRIPDANTPFLLTLGRLENLASVSVNGRPLGISWLPPYELDISAAVHFGINTLVIDVTNLWVNRLIGDELLPVEDKFNTMTQNYAVEAWPQWWLGDKAVKDGERDTFGAWHHYNSTAPLLTRREAEFVKFVRTDGQLYCDWNGTCEIVLLLPTVTYERSMNGPLETRGDVKSNAA